MAVPASDRPLDKVKEEVIDQLILNYSHGELSADAFERRLDQAYACEDQTTLLTLVVDLPLQTDPRYHTEKAARMQPQFTPSNNSEPQLNIRSILSTEHVTGEWIVPKEIYINNYTGNTELDFSNAVFTHPEVTVTINNIMGQDDFIVPDNVDVSLSTSNIMGSVSNKRPRLAMTNFSVQRPHIHIRGKIILGSVEVRVKQSMKQQIKHFADSLKDLFSEKSKLNN